MINAFRMLEVFGGLSDEAAYVLDWCPSLVTIAHVKGCPIFPTPSVYNKSTIASCKPIISKGGC